MQKAKILVCDDEQAVRRSLKYILHDKFELSYASDGPEALEHIKRNPTDIILLDLKMPKMDGMRVLKEVKKSRPKIKVIVVTGYSTVATAYRAIKTGASDYITKPFDKDYIIQAIEKVLKEK